MPAACVKLGPRHCKSANAVYVKTRSAVGVFDHCYVLNSEWLTCLYALQEAPQLRLQHRQDLRPNSLQ